MSWSPHLCITLNHIFWKILCTFLFCTLVHKTVQLHLNNSHIVHIVLILIVIVSVTFFMLLSILKFYIYASKHQGKFLVCENLILIVLFLLFSLEFYSCQYKKPLNHIPSIIDWHFQLKPIILTFS